MKRRLVMMVLLAALPDTAAPAACQKPDAPGCALARVPFASDKDADDCRKEMLAFRDAAERHASCVGATSPDAETAAREAYEDVRARFNRRARGEAE
jgi:hypothetical protein